MRNLLVVLALSLAATACATDNTASSDDDASAPGKLALWQAADGWHFHVVSGNGRILMTSEAYTDRTGALNGVLSVMENGVDPHMYQVESAAHGYLLHLVAANNEVIAFTETYSTKSSATRAITSCVNAMTSYLDKRAANSGARAEIEEGTTGQFHFNLFAQNGQVVMTSETYTTIQGAWNGEFAAQDAVTAGTFTIKTATNGQYYFVETASNGDVVGTSELYTTKAAAQAGITAVQTVLETVALI